MEFDQEMINWENSESHVLVNPSYSTAEHTRFQNILGAASDWEGHIWLSTSGTSSPKWVGLSKQALLASACAVNHHLEIDTNDAWVNPLPHFHVGGLGILARAHLSGAVCHDFKRAFPGKWEPEAFYHYLCEMQGTLTSLVPAQLHDLIKLGKKAPPSLRAVVIGGGAILPLLYEKSLGLNWPILPSYGMTECASQIATAPLECWKQGVMPCLHLLSHVQGCVENRNLCFAGPSLLSAYAYLDQDQVVFVDPKRQGWLKTEDRGKIENGIVEVYGRSDNVLKVGGESVDLDRLENHLHALKLQSQFSYEVALVAMKDSRLGDSIHLASDSPSLELLASLLNIYQGSVLPFERIRRTHLFKELPRSPLGKILKQNLVDMIVNLTR